MNQHNVIFLSDARLRRLATKYRCTLILIDEAQRKISERAVSVHSREDMIARLWEVSGGRASILPQALAGQRACVQASLPRNSQLPCHRLRLRRSYSS